MDQLYNPSVRKRDLPSDSRNVQWRDLREWLALIDKHGQLKRVSAPVEADEELSGLTYMLTRNERAPALLFENVSGASYGSKVLTNMLGNSSERYALALGLDVGLPVRDLINETRRIMRDRIPPVMIPGEAA